MEKWVRVMCDYSAEGLWAKDGCAMDIESLPVSRSVCFDLGAWQAFYEHQPTQEPMPEKELKWFSVRGLVIAKAIKTELPDWTVIYFDEGKIRHGDLQQPRSEFEYEVTN